MYNIIHTTLCHLCIVKWQVKVLLSQSCLTATPGTATHQVPLSMEFSRQGYWSGLPCPPPGDLPNPGIRTRVSHIAGGSFTVWTTREVQEHWNSSLSLLQRIFPTQKLIQDLLHCRQILYQLRYQVRMRVCSKENRIIKGLDQLWQTFYIISTFP